MTLPKFFRLLVFGAILIGSAVLLGSIGWPQPDRTREFCAVILAAILTSAFAIPRSTAEDRGMMTPPFVVDFTALLLLGGNAALFVAAAGIMTRCLADPDGARPLRRLLVNAGSIMIAIEAASLTVVALGAVAGRPDRGGPRLVLLREEHLGRSDCAAREQVGDQSSVAEGSARERSELFHRRRRRRRADRNPRPPHVGAVAGRRRAALLRLSRVLR